MSMDEVVSYRFAGTRILIDGESLRDLPEDPAAVSSWCEEHPRDPRTVTGLRLLGRLEEAEQLGREVLEDTSASPLQRAVRRARVAQVLQWQGRYREADEAYALAAEETGVGDPTERGALLVLASILGHRATSRLEQSAREASAEHGDASRVERLRSAAAEDAERALAIRSACEAPAELLASSRRTVQRITPRS